MQVDHDVTDDDRRPENLEAAHQRRQAAEDAETVRVRGPQRPGDLTAPGPAPRQAPRAKAEPAEAKLPPPAPATSQGPAEAAPVGHNVGALTTADIKPKQTVADAPAPRALPRPKGKA